MKLALTDSSCCLGHTDVVVGHAPKRQVDILETRYNVYETLADCVVVATDDHAGITGVYCVVVDEILAKFLFQRLLREKYIFNHSCFYSCFTGSVQSLNFSGA